MSKTIYEMDFTDNFPDALCYDPKMVALGAIAAVELEEVNDEMKNAMIYERIDELPEKVLDVLAYDFNADLYRYCLQHIREKNHWRWRKIYVRLTLLPARSEKMVWKH